MVSLIGCTEDGIAYVVPPKKRDCFYKDLKEGTKMDLDMQVISGGSNVDISVDITDPSGTSLLSLHKVQEASENIDVRKAGEHSICFDNTFSAFAEKIVYFDLGIIEPDDNSAKSGGRFDGIEFEQEHDVNSDALQAKIIESLTQIRVTFDEINAQQSMAKARMSRHHYLQDHNLSMVTWFSGSSCLLMMCVAGLQAFLIKRLFK